MAFFMVGVPLYISLSAVECTRSKMPNILWSYHRESALAWPHEAPLPPVGVTGPGGPKG
jgi:hypothetical protein